MSEDADRESRGLVDETELLAIEAPGADEVAIVAWPLLWRERVQTRATSSDRYPWIVLVASLFGLFSVGFTITVLSVSFVAIADDLGTSTDVLTWVITGPILAYAVVGPAAGKLADLYGSRRVYQLSMLGVAVFAALTAVAWSVAALIAFRVIGAAVGAAVGPSSLAMINKHFPPHRRAQALGYWALVAAGGPVIGVVVGGPIVEIFGWRAIFVLQVPMTLVALAIGWAVLPETDRRRDVRFDFAGSATLAVGVGALLVGLNRAPSLGWTSAVVLACFVMFVAFIGLFVWVEARATHPLIPLHYFAKANFAFPIANQFFANFAYMGGFVISPLLMQEVLGFGETKTGLLSIARPLAFAIAGPIAGYITVRVGERRNAVAGSLFIVASMIGLSMVGVTSSELFIVGVLALSGVGMGTCAPAMAAAVANAVSEQDLGVAGAAQQMVAQVGVVAGIQILQTVQESREATMGAEGSYHAAYLVGAVFAGFGVVMAVFVRSRRREEGAPQDAPSESVLGEFA